MALSCCVLDFNLYLNCLKEIFYKLIFVNERKIYNEKSIKSYNDNNIITRRFWFER